MKDLIYRADLIAEIERQQGLLHPYDRLEVDNVKQIVRDMPAAEVVRELRAKIETDMAMGMIPTTVGNRLLRYLSESEYA